MKSITKIGLLVCVVLLACLLSLTACGETVSETNPTGTVTTITTDSSNLPESSTTLESGKVPVHTEAPHAHLFGAWTVVKDASCTEEGREERSCTCGETEFKTIEILSHTEVIDKAVDPTCTETGLTEGKHCDVCGEVLVAQETLSANGHSHTAVVKKPTCTEKGYTTYTCHCGDTYKANDVNELGHSEVTDKAVDPTCTETGLTEGKHCDVCGEVLVAQETRPANGHSYTAVVINPTCTEKGYTTYTCHCGDTYQANPVKELGHSYTAMVKKPTCTEKGYTTYTCHCGDTYKANTVKELGHSEVTDKAVAPTCTETGLTEGKHCDVCGEVLVAQKTRPANGHGYTAVVINPTCTEKGYTTYTCHCGDTYKANTVKELGHSYTAVVKKPTCTEKGYTTYTCHCGDTYKANPVKELGHSEVTDKAVDPTCTETGLTEGKHCDVCGEVLVAQETLPAGHDYNAVITAPTCTEKGYTTYTCHCGDSYVDAYTDPEHTYTDRTYVCNKCGQKAEGLYDANDNMVASWDELVNTYGLNVEQDYYFTASPARTIFAESALVNGVKLVIGDVASIGAYAFAECSSLESVIIPDSVVRVGEGAFDHCTSLIHNVYDHANYLGNTTNPYYVLVSVTDKNITSCTIHSNTKMIGDYVFTHCYSLTSVTIPNGVTSIGEDAFRYCHSLERVTIPNSVTSIGRAAFNMCESLTSVTIPNSVTSIGAYAFYGCISLTSMTIPDSVASIGTDAFYYCTSLESITVSKNNPKYCSIDGVLYSKDKTELMVAPGAIRSVVIPDGTLSVWNSAFDHCESLTSVTISDSVTSIGMYAFASCTGLTRLIIPGSVTSIGEGALDYCTNLANVYCEAEDQPAGWNAAWLGNCSAAVHWGYVKASEGLEYTYNSVTDSYIVSGIGSCGDTDIVIPSEYDGKPVTEIGKFAFYKCKNLTSVTIPNSVTSIGDSAFSECRNLTSVTIPNSVTSIGDSAFAECTNLIKVTIPESVTNICDSAFAECTRLTDLTIPNSLTSIGGSVFYGCESLTYTIYDHAKYLGNATNPYHILVSAVDTSITSCIIHPNTKLIADYAFADCESLTNVTIPDSVTSIGAAAFLRCTSLTDMIIPDGVTSIDYYTFEGCTNLTNVIIPDSVTSVGGAFLGCESLVYTIYDHAKYLGNATNPYHVLVSVVDTSITSCTIHPNTKVIAADAFAFCESLESITIPDSVKTIGDYAFLQCYSLRSLTIGNGVTSIGNHAFHDCRSLESVMIPDSVTNMGYDAFSGCTYLAHVTIGNGLTSIDNLAFYYCVSLTSLTIGNNVTSIGNHAFYYCFSLTHVTIPDSVKYIGDYAFDLCDSLANISFTGTKEQWKAISKGYIWNNDVPATMVQCSDGTVDL